MYSTRIGRNVKSQFNRRGAYVASIYALDMGHRSVTVLNDAETVEARLFKVGDKIGIWTPDIADRAGVVILLRELEKEGLISDVSMD